MNIGHFLIEQLSEGVFEVSDDGAIGKIHAPNRQKKQEQSALLSLSQKNVSRVGLDPVFVTNGKYHILLDAGLGIGLDAKERNSNTSNIITNLEIFGVQPTDIDFVVLSHLHYDHIAGLSYTDDIQKTHATLPNARIILQKEEWDFAVHHAANNLPGFESGYLLDEMYRLFAEGRITLIDKEFYTLLHGIDLIKTGGHTPGHQIVRIHNRNDSAYYFGDLIPSEQDLNYYGMRNKDTDAKTSQKMKLLLLKQAWEEQAMLLFYHSLQIKNGRLVKDEMRRYALAEAGL